MRTTIGVLGLLAGWLTAATVVAYTAEQASKGQEVYSAHCAVCHGADGHGGKVPEAFGGYAGMKAPPVVGKGALPNMETAENVYTFLKQHMPLQKPGSLSDEEYLNIVAFDVKANNLAKPSNEALMPAQLSGMKLKKK